MTSRSLVNTYPKTSAAAANTTPHTAMNAKHMTNVTYMASSALFPSPAPSKFPILMVLAMATANGSERNASVASCNIVRCASNATVPRYPASSVVISKLHASMSIMIAPGPARTQKPLDNLINLCLGISHRTGLVFDARSRVLQGPNAYAIASNSWNHRHMLVATGAPLNPIFAGPKMSTQLRITLNTVRVTQNTTSSV